MSRGRVFLALVVAMAATPGRVQGAAGQETVFAATTVLDGVYTASQASRGQQKFQQVCTACHSVSEHAGAAFGVRWGGSSVGELLEMISTTMPEGDPGALTLAEYTDILAFFLKESGYPEGRQEMPAEAARLMKVRIEPLRK